MPVSKRYGAAAAGYRRTKKSKWSRQSIYRKRGRPRPKGKFARKVMNVVNKSAETKEVMSNIATNLMITHNTVTNLNSNALTCQLGVFGETLTGVSGYSGCRIGNRIFVKGIQVAMHIENQQYRPNVMYQLYLIRNKHNRDLTISNKSQMFEGLNTTIPLDYIDTAQVDILFSKKFKVKQDGMGTTLEPGGAGVFDTSKVVVGGDPLPFVYEGIDTVVTNGRWMGKFYVPINKSILYQDAEDTNARQVPSTYRYQWVIYGYDNRSTTTGDTTWPIGHVNMTTKMKFTDV